MQVTGKVAGTTTVTVTASNAAGSTDQTFQVTVEAAPVTRSCSRRPSGS